MDDLHCDSISISGFDSTASVRSIEVFVYIDEKCGLPVIIKDTVNFHSLAELPLCPEVIRMYALEGLGQHEVVKRDVFIRNVDLSDRDKRLLTEKMK